MSLARRLSPARSPDARHTYPSNARVRGPRLCASERCTHRHSLSRVRLGGVQATFHGATSFDQPLDSWDVSSEVNVRSMFYNATSLAHLPNWYMGGGCSSINDNYSATIADPRQCSFCSEATIGQAVMLIISASLGFLAIGAAYIVILLRYPQALKSWASSITILICHMQTISIIGSIGLPMPVSVQAIMSALGLDFIQMPSMGCLPHYGGVFAFWLYVLSASGVMLFFLVVLVLLRWSAARYGRPSLADKLEFALSAAFSFQLVLAWRIVAEYALKLVIAVVGIFTRNDQLFGVYGIDIYNLDISHVNASIISLKTVIMLVLVQLQLYFHFKGNVNAFCRGVSGGGWSIAVGSTCATAGSNAFAVVALGGFVIYFVDMVQRGVSWVEWRAAIDDWTTLLIIFASAVLPSIIAVCCSACCLPRYCRRPRTSIAPRRLEKRVCYFTQRFAPHAPRWQWTIWARQLAIFALAVVSRLIKVLAPDSHSTAVYIIAIIALVVVAAFWQQHRRKQPFAYRFQNAMESALFATNMLLIIFLSMYALLRRAMQADSAALIVCEVVLMIVLLGSLLGAALIIIRDARTMGKKLANIDLSRVLSQANDQINAPLRTALANGDVRLLRCSWVASPEADAHLGYDPASGAVRMKRMQELPDEAFFSPQQAAALLDRGDRSILALSYRWLTAFHPEPRGTTLLTVRRYLNSAPDAVHCGLFWECAHTRS